MKKFSQDYVEARRLYLRAIEIGEALLEGTPDSFEFRTHLAIALDDLAGVARKQGRFQEARPLFQEAERHFRELVRADPEHLDSRLALLHTQYNCALLDRDESQFDAAIAGFRGVRDRLSVLKREGRLEERRGLFVDTTALDKEIASCEAASRVPRTPRSTADPSQAIKPPG